MSTSETPGDAKESDAAFVEGMDRGEPYNGSSVALARRALAAEAEVVRLRAKGIGKRPVAFRVKDYADGWILFHDEEKAAHEAEQMSNDYQGLYVLGPDAQFQQAGKLEISEAAVERFALAWYAGWATFTDKRKDILKGAIKTAFTAVLPLLGRGAGWLPIETAPEDGTEVCVYAPSFDGLPSMVSKCAWHEDAGFCIDELRAPTLWTPLPAPSGATPPNTPAVITIKELFNLSDEEEAKVNKACQPPAGDDYDGEALKQMAAKTVEQDIEDFWEATKEPPAGVDAAWAEYEAELKGYTEEDLLLAMHAFRAGFAANKSALPSDAHRILGQHIASVPVTEHAVHKFAHDLALALRAAPAPEMPGQRVSDKELDEHVLPWVHVPDTEAADKLNLARDLWHLRRAWAARTGEVKL